MTKEEAIKLIKQSEQASWAYTVDKDGTVYLGGQDHLQARVEALAKGYNGPFVRVY